MFLHCNNSENLNKRAQEFLSTLPLWFNNKLYWEYPVNQLSGIEVLQRGNAVHGSISSIDGSNGRTDFVFAPNIGFLRTECLLGSRPFLGLQKQKICDDFGCSKELFEIKSNEYATFSNDKKICWGRIPSCVHQNIGYRTRLGWMSSKTNPCASCLPVFLLSTFIHLELKIVSKRHLKLLINYGAV